MGPGRLGAVLLAGVALSVLPLMAAAQQDRPSDDARNATADTAAETARDDTDGADGMEEMVVVGERRGVTKLKVPVEDLPQTVVSIPRAVIEDRSLVRLEEIAEVAVGVRPTLPYTGGVSLGFFVRGFNGAPILVDGVNAGVTSGFASTIQNLAFVDAVEVLRGPASVLYGQGNPGGVVNLVLKRPQDRFGWLIDGELDSHGGRRLDLDATGGLTGDLSGRLVVSLEDSDTFRDFGEVERWAVAPALTWTLGDRWKFDVFYAYDRYRFNNDRGFGFDGTLLALEIPVERNLSEPDLPLNEFENQTLRASAAVALGGDWEAILAYSRYQQKTIAAPEIGFLGPVQPGGTLIERYFQQTVDPDENRSRDHTISLSFAGSIDTGPLSHDIYISAERVDTFYRYRAAAGTVDPIDALNPVYQERPLGPTDTFLYSGFSASETTAIYAQDLISIGETLKLLAGGRLDFIDTDSAFTEDPDGVAIGGAQEETALTPRAGLVWDPREGTTLFVNYSRSFLPQPFTDSSGNLLDPERARSIELGFRQEFLDGRANVTAAIYQINRTDLVVTDPADNDFLINGGEGRSRGAEFEFTLDVTDAWSVEGGFAYTDAEVLVSDFAVPGETLPGASPWTATLFTKYEVPPDLLGLPRGGLGLFAGLSYASRAPWVQPIREPDLPAFAKVDLGFEYDPGWGVEIQGTVENVFDERIVLSNGFGLTGPTSPRTFLVSLIWRGGSLR